MRRRLAGGAALALAGLLAQAGSATDGFAQGAPAVHVTPAAPEGSRPLAPQTRAAAVRDYIEAWRTMRTALASNEPGPLDGSFTGLAREALANTIASQQGLHLSTQYTDRSHDLRFVFYSPEGLSLELTDDVTYEVSVTEGGKPLASHEEHAHYLVVLTPSEVSWRVRIFQTYQP